MFRIFALLMAIGIVWLGIFASRSAAQLPQIPPVPIAVHKLRANAYWIEGGETLSSNSGVILGDKAVILFDTKSTIHSEQDTLAEVAKITSKPVTTVIVSHNDFDHIGGLPALPKGITIIAQDNCKKRMEQSVGRGPMGASPDYLPTKTYSQGEHLTIEGVTMNLFHWAPAHTDGDTVLFLPKEKVVFAGDVLMSAVPMAYLHVKDEGGSASGWLENLRKLAALDADVYVTGHGDVMDKVEVKRRLAAGEKTFEQVKMLVAQGKTLAEIQQQLGDVTPAKGPFGMPLPYFSEFAYQELTAQH
jgi:cyclase